ncbi:recombinase family protein [Mobilicoccus sp.]|uniref:recombinase family protein n=1 Tax=Mobilicoccus sp. TaxID=2034349 RepID=UPI0028AAE780|nr:recombinase family protein [Mobilicoccus sp.]
MTTCAIYARQSLDRKQDQLAVSRQLTLCRKYAADQGWDVAGEYVDNDQSATSGKVRPEFERLLKDRPERIVVWHTDRLVRLTKDLERVIALGVNVHALKAGDLDLSNPAGRAVARTITAWATYETEQKAVRQRAANDQRAEEGLPYICQRAFGYESDGMTIREDEAAELRAAADGVLRGRSLNSMCTDLNERGVRTATGRTWKVVTLKAALLSPRNAGLRRHRGQVVGKAAWPAILDEETAAAVRAVLTDPSRARKGPTRRYLLSGILRCGVCGGPVVGTYIKAEKGLTKSGKPFKAKGETYRCTGHVSRKVADVDEYVTGVVVARLARPDAAELFSTAGAEDRSGDLRSERESLRGRLDGLAEAFALGDIDRLQLKAGSERINARLSEIETELAATVADPTLAEIAGADDVAEAWAALPMDTQRQVVDALMSLELLKVGPGRRTFDPTESLRLTWKG